MVQGNRELLTAALLRSSRQHVVDLCKRGLLPHFKVGTHRRIRRADIDAVLSPRLTRDQLRSLWLHRAVAGKLVADPEAVLAKAAVNLERLHQVHPQGMAAAWLDRWDAVIGEGPEAVLGVLTSRAPHAAEMRQNSPFAGVLSKHERQAVLASFTITWKAGRAA